MHLCIVTEFLGPSLDDMLRNESDACELDLVDPIEPDDILRFTKLLLEATAVLHDAGFAHGSSFSVDVSVAKS